MIILFVITVTVIMLSLAIIWTPSNIFNALAKIVFSMITFWGAYILFHLLPAIELTSGMRVL